MAVGTPDKKSYFYKEWWKYGQRAGCRYRDVWQFKPRRESRDTEYALNGGDTFWCCPFTSRRHVPIVLGWRVVSNGIPWVIR